jgi:hypothetical protein
MPKTRLEPTLAPYASLNPITRIEAARGIRAALRTNPFVERGLPYVAAGYRTLPRGYLRLMRVAHGSQAAKLEPRLITVEDAVVGIAASQFHEPRAVASMLPKGNGAVELSFWTGRFDEDEAWSSKHIGRRVLGALVADRDNSEVLWLVALDDDRVTNFALTMNQFVPVGELGAVDLGDGSLAPERTIWARDPANT